MHMTFDLTELMERCLYKLHSNSSELCEYVCYNYFCSTVEWVNLVDTKFGGFGQNTVFFKLANFKFDDLVPQPKNDVTTTT